MEIKIPNNIKTYTNMPTIKPAHSKSTFTLFQKAMVSMKNDGTDGFTVIKKSQSESVIKKIGYNPCDSFSMKLNNVNTRPDIRNFSWFK